MTSKLGTLGAPRIGIALIWFVDAGPEIGIATPSPVTPPVTPEDVEFVRGLTGLDPDALVSRLRDIAALYDRDREAMRAEILRITGGDEIAAEYLVKLMHAAQPGGEQADGDEPGPESGRVIDFGQPSGQNEDDDQGGGDRTR
jgi:hypothetical protein